MSTLLERLKEACGTKIKPAHLAKACGVSRTAAGKWFDGGEIKTENIFPIADYCQVEARWLALGEGPKHNLTTDPLAKRLFELWPKLDGATKGELLGIAIGRTDPPDVDGVHDAKRA